ncbi:MAG: TetR/AcrR family transcriptional regulator [Anaerolineae bacterium]|nr:TetR/AcrR family transcriptional regulator [Anaerolineae bacterium]
MVRTVKKPEERRTEIVAAARDLFYEQGYEKTTMRHVMDKLDIAKGTIYHYFSSKEDLLEAVVNETVDGIRGMLEQFVENAQGSALQILQQLIAAGSAVEEAAPILEGLHDPANTGMHTRQLAETITKLAPIYASVIERGVAEGVFQTQHPLEAAEMILTAVQFLTDMGIYHWTPEVLMRRALAFPALIEAQLHAPKGSFDFLLPQNNQ